MTTTRKEKYIYKEYTDMRSEQGKAVSLPLEKKYISRIYRYEVRTGQGRFTTTRKKKNIYISRIYRFEVGTDQSRQELLTTTRKVYRVGMARNKINILQLLQCA